MNKHISLLGIVFVAFSAGCFGALSQTYDTNDGRGNYNRTVMDPFTMTVTGRTNVETQQGLIDRCVTRYQNYTYELRPVALPNGHAGVIAIQRSTLAGDPIAQCTNEMMHGMPLNNPNFWGGGMIAPFGMGYGGYPTSHGMMRVGAPGFYKSFIDTIKDLF